FIQCQMVEKLSFGPFLIHKVAVAHVEPVMRIILTGEVLSFISLKGLTGIAFIATHHIGSRARGLKTFMIPAEIGLISKGIPVAVFNLALQSLRGARSKKQKAK